MNQVQMETAVIKWAIILASTLGVLVLFFSWGLQNGKKADAKRTAPIIEQLNTDLGQCRSTVATQEGALAAQNAAVVRLQAEGEQRATEAAVALRKAQDAATVYRKRAERIAAAKPGPDQCISARNLIIDTLGEDRQ